MPTSHPPEGALFLKRLSAGRVPPHGHGTPWPEPGKATRKCNTQQLKICRTGFHLAPFTGSGVRRWYHDGTRCENWLAEVSPDARVFVSQTYADKFVCTQAELVKQFDLGYVGLTNGVDGQAFKGRNILDRLILGATWFNTEYAKAPHHSWELR